MNSKKRCSACKGYFEADEMINAGLSGVCSTECLEDLKNKYRDKRKRRQYHRENRRRYGRRLPGQTRDKVRKRDGSRCRWCGTGDGRIEIHHVRYRSQGGGDTLDNLLTLCQAHHLEAHSSKRKWQAILQMVLWIGYVPGRHVMVPEVERVFGSELRFSFDSEEPNEPYEEGETDELTDVDV